MYPYSPNTLRYYLEKFFDNKKFFLLFFFGATPPQSPTGLGNGPNDEALFNTYLKRPISRFFHSKFQLCHVIIEQKFVFSVIRKILYHKNGYQEILFIYSRNRPTRVSFPPKGNVDLVRSFNSRQALSLAKIFPIEKGTSLKSVEPNKGPYSET